MKEKREEYLFSFLCDALRLISSSCFLDYDHIIGVKCLEYSACDCILRGIRRSGSLHTSQEPYQACRDGAKLVLQKSHKDRDVWLGFHRMHLVKSERKAS